MAYSSPSSAPCRVQSLSRPRWRARSACTHVAGTASHGRVAGAVGARKLLLVIDNCEHVIEAAAGMAEALLRASPGVSLLATSREPLRVSGEYVYRVPPLDVPPEDDRDSGRRLQARRGQALRVAGTRRGATVRCRGPRRGGDDRHLPAPRRDPARDRACRDAHRGVRCRWCGRPPGRPLQTAHRRQAHGAAPSPDDARDPRLELRAAVRIRAGGPAPVGVFAGVFTLDEASVVAASADIPASDVADSVANLVGKSLLSADVGGAVVHYRLLETTRAYAREKLIGSAEFDHVARRHAEYYRDLFQHAEAELETRPTAEWLAAYRPHIDDLRAALDWAFSPSGDVGVGVALTAAAVPLWTHLSLLTECRATSRASRCKPRTSGALRSPPRHAPVSRAWPRSIAYPHECRPGHERRVDKGSRACRDHGRRTVPVGSVTRTLSRSPPDGRVSRCSRSRRRRFAPLRARRRLGPMCRSATDSSVLHYTFWETRPVRDDTSSHWLARDFVTARPSHISFYQYDQRVVLDCYYARVLWLQGFGDKAKGLTDNLVDYARTSDHLRSFLYTLLVAACPIALFVGDLTTVEHHVRLAFDLAARHALEIWNVWAQCFEGSCSSSEGTISRARNCSSRRSRDCPSPPFITT